MNRRFAALALALAFIGLGAGPLFPAASAALSPTAQAPESFAAEAASLDALLGRLDGGALTQALRALALKGAPLRLLLDPAQAETRREGLALSRLTPSAQVRWLEGAGKPLRRLLSPAGQLLWRPGNDASRADDGLARARKRFEREWQGAALSLPEGQRLEDELHGLPDPRVGVPHLSRRRDAVDRSPAEDSPDAEPAPLSPTPSAEMTAAPISGAAQTEVTKDQESSKADDADHPRP